MEASDITYSEVELLRDCSAILVPDGNSVTLNAGVSVYVVQALGGAITVNVNGNLARIAPNDVDALGVDVEPSPFENHPAHDSNDISEELLWAQMSTCYDPEIPINIVELGLIYRCEVIDNARVEVDLTLTAPGCGMGPFLLEDVRYKVLQVPNVKEVAIELVFDPPWNPEMMSEAARLETGMY